MQALTLSDIKSLDTYLAEREERRREMITLRNRRRLAIGEIVSLGFENRQTLSYQIQEMMRAENMRDERRIVDEIETYNQLVPGKNELSATLFLEIKDPSLIKDFLHRFRGIEDSIYLDLGSAGRVQAEPDEKRSTEETTASVHYLRFRLNPEQAEAFLNGEGKVRALVEHPQYHESAVIDGGTWEELAADLRGA